MLSDDKLKFFADYIQREIGIIYSDNVYYQLNQRLEKVKDHLGFQNLDELYNEAIKKGILGEFRSYLLDISTNNETSFFRDAKIYIALLENILPSIIEKWPDQNQFKIWSAAASFGQEPYSIAMIVDEFVASGYSEKIFSIMSSDISDSALERCRRGVYSKLEVQRGLSPEKLKKYFYNENDSSWILKDSIKNRVIFKKINLLDSFSMLGQFHLIFCRYVLIYQDTNKKKDIMKRLVNQLVPGGYLVLGGSESIIGMDVQLKQIEYKGAVYYQKTV